MTNKLFLIAALFFASAPQFAHAGPTEQFDELYRQARSECAAKHYDRAADLAAQAEHESGVPLEKRISNVLPLASCYRSMNQLAQAEESYQRLLELMPSTPEHTPTGLVFVLVSLADVYVLDQQPNRAEPLALRAVTLAERAARSETDLIGPLGALGNVYLAQGKLVPATSALERAIRIADTVKFQAGSYFQNLYSYTAKLYRMTGREAEALVFEKRAAAVVTSIAVATNVRPTKASVVPDSCKFEYPWEAIVYLLTGEAQVKFSVDVMGQPQNLVISKSSGWQVLDKATLNGFSRCRYTPATRAGKPVQDELTVGYRWTLDSDTPTVPPKLIKDSCPPSTQFTVAPEDATGSTILVRFLLDPEGKPYRTVVESSPPRQDTDAMAIRFVESCRYQPTIFKGKAVPNTANIRLLMN